MIATQYFVIKQETLDALIKNADSKTFIILHYIINIAQRAGLDFSLPYKNIEKALGVGHTIVGRNLRVFRDLNIIKKTGISSYSINDRLIKFQIETSFDNSLY